VNGSHLFTTQGETSVGGGLDWTQPFTKAADSSKLKFGGLLSHKSRDFKARRFHYAPTAGDTSLLAFSCGATFHSACPDSYYTNGNIATALDLLEDTRSEDAYKASLDIYSGYGLLDFALGESIRVVGGARVEATSQEIAPYTQYRDDEDPEGAKIDSVDVLPALSIAYSATKKSKVRASLARTLARPQIRELSPFEFTEFFGGRTFKGEPNLKLTYINNADLRFEYFPTQREVLAFSFFFKDFQDPIENIVVNSGDGVIRPQNARGGTLLGLELEARKTLAFIVEELRDFSAIANLTLAKSKVDLDVSEATVQVTNPFRAMLNQAPFVVNVALDYSNESSGTSARVLYNVSGKRIVEVGTDDLPDVYEQPKHALDVTVSQNLGKHWQLKLAAANLLGSQTTFTLGPEKNDDRVTARYTDSRVFSLSGTYTY
jgi:TonB-dependent receptor